MFIIFLQRKWRKRDKKDPVKIHDEEAGIVIPRIPLPITEKQHRDLVRTVQQMDISWNDSVDSYIRIRQHVLKRIERNEYYSDVESGGSDAQSSDSDD